ncbi:MAG: hypothetical protein M3040_01705, partial [Bacteroidota bacterium]|nr:hypothetical protein [Bacteroidota bacterium]
MKKKSLILGLLFTTGILMTDAQIERANVLVGGDIANFRLTLDEPSTFSADIKPKAAVFIKDNTALGAYAHVGLNTQRGKGTDFLYGLGFLARQYISSNAIPAVTHTRFFAEANVGIEGENHSKSSTNTTTNGLGIGIGPGLAYFITPNIGLEGLVLYQGILGFGTRVTTNELNFNVGFQIYLPARGVRRAATNTQ